MMVPKIITHAAVVIVQNKNDQVQVLGRGARSKSKRHFPPASILGSSINVPATRLERQLRTLQSNRTQGYVVHFTITDCCFTLTGKKLELVEEIRDFWKRQGISRYCWSFFYQETWFWSRIDLNGWWKLFYSGADPSTSLQVGVGIPTSPQLSNCVFDWIPLGLRVCVLKLKVKDRRLCL